MMKSILIFVSVVHILSGANLLAAAHNCCPWSPACDCANNTQIFWYPWECVDGTFQLFDDDDYEDYQQDSPIIMSCTEHQLTDIHYLKAFCFGIVLGITALSVSCFCCLCLDEPTEMHILVPRNPREHFPETVAYNVYTGMLEIPESSEYSYEYEVC